MSDETLSPVTIAERYLAALSAGDVEGALACVADGFVNEHTSALGSSSEGREVYRQRLPGFLGQFDGLHYELVEAICEPEPEAGAAGAAGAAGDGRVAARYRLTAVFDGHPIDIPGVMLITVTGGEIVRRTDVWDSLTFLRQTGAG